MSAYTLNDIGLKNIRHATDLSGSFLRSYANNTKALAGLTPFASPVFEQAANLANAMAESIETPFREYPDPGFNLDQTTINGETIAVEQKTVMAKPFCDLDYWDRKTDRNDPQLLLIGPFSGHYLSLLRDTVEELLPHHCIYGTNWKNARDVSLKDAPKFDQDDQILYIKEFLEYLGSDTHVMAVCQPTYPLIAALCLMAKEGKAMPASVTLMAGPVDVGAAHSEVAEFPKSSYFSPFINAATSTVPLCYPGAGRKVHMGSAQLFGFMSPNMDTHITKQLEKHVSTVFGDDDEAQRIKKFYADYFAVMDLPKEFIDQTIQRVFIDRELAVGTLIVNGVPIEPKLIKNLPLLTIEGEMDPISPVGHTKAAHEILSNIPHKQRFHHEEPGAKHYSCFSGRRWRNSISKQVAGFIRKFSGNDYSPAPKEKTISEPKNIKKQWVTKQPDPAPLHDAYTV